MLLGGASALHADDLSVSGAPLPSTIAPPMYGVFSRVPENWSDLPLQLNFKESFGYNSNILNTPQTRSGANAGFGQPLGSPVSISNFGAATKYYWEGQQFFADGSLGMYQYYRDNHLNSQANSFDIGDNWTYGHRCSGKLILSERTSPAEPGQQVGFNVQNRLTTISFNETGTCLASGNYAFVLNSGTTRSTNSAAIDKLNDFRSVFVAAGITYTVSETNSLQLLTTVTGIDFTNRQTTVSNVGLFNNITEDQIGLTYTKNFGPNVAVIASGGVVGVRDGSFSLEPASSFEPVYSLSATWAATPKLHLAAALSRTVSPPTSVLANIQVTENANLRLDYSLTPKVLIAATVSASRSSGNFGGTPGFSTSTPINRVFASNSDYYSANASINYAMTPFVTANLSYTYNKTVQSNLVTPTNVVLLAVTYSPY